MSRTLCPKENTPVLRVHNGRSETSEPLAGYTPDGGPDNWTQGAVLIHAYEELAQHLGQMDITKDLLLRDGSGLGIPAVTTDLLEIPLLRLASVGMLSE